MREVRHFSRTSFAPSCAGQPNQQEFPRKSQENLEDILPEKSQHTFRIKLPANPTEAQ
jgi:hypothetical protein